jgi:hypothetical protein
MSAALPSSFLEVFFAKGIKASEDTAKGGDVPGAEQWAGVCKIAKVLCKIGTFIGLLCVHGDSVLAAASIATTRCISKIEPSWPTELQNEYPVTAGPTTEMHVESGRPSLRAWLRGRGLTGSSQKT